MLASLPATFNSTPSWSRYWATGPQCEPGCPSLSINATRRDICWLRVDEHGEHASRFCDETVDDGL
jgi:hypothetical protein